MPSNIRVVKLPVDGSMPNSNPNRRLPSTRRVAETRASTKNAKEKVPDSPRQRKSLDRSKRRLEEPISTLKNLAMSKRAKPNDASGEEDNENDELDTGPNEADSMSTLSHLIGMGEIASANLRNQERIIRLEASVAKGHARLVDSRKAIDEKVHKNFDDVVTLNEELQVTRAKVEDVKSSCQQIKTQLQHSISEETQAVRACLIRTFDAANTATSGHIGDMRSTITAIEKTQSILADKLHAQDNVMHKITQDNALFKERMTEDREAHTENLGRLHNSFDTKIESHMHGLTTQIGKVKQHLHDVDRDWVKSIQQQRVANSTLFKHTKSLFMDWRSNARGLDEVRQTLRNEMGDVQKSIKDLQETKAIKMEYDIGAEVLNGFTAEVKNVQSKIEKLCGLEKTMEDVLAEISKLKSNFETSINTQKEIQDSYVSYQHLETELKSTAMNYVSKSDMNRLKHEISQELERAIFRAAQDQVKLVLQSAFALPSQNGPLVGGPTYPANNIDGSSNRTRRMPTYDPGMPNASSACPTFIPDSLRASLNPLPLQAIGQRPSSHQPPLQHTLAPESDHRRYSHPIQLAQSLPLAPASSRQEYNRSSSSGIQKVE